MPLDLIDLILPLIIILVIAGYQISIYFLYLYLKFKKEKLYLNKVLLSFSSFFGLGLTGIFLRNINRFFIYDHQEKLLFLKITNFIFILAIFFFLLFITSKSFNEIINSKLTKIVCCINIIPLISILLFQPGSYILYYLISIVFIGIIYMFFFQVKLIKRSTKKIKIRLLLIFIGEIIIGGAMFIGGELFMNIFFSGIGEAFLIGLIALSIIALMIIFLGVFNFPPFLEFEWRNYLLSLFIVNQKKFEIIYQFNFNYIQDELKDILRDSSDLGKDKVFFSRGIFGINDIISGITNINEGGIEKIRQGEITILLNQGDDPLSFIVYGLLIRKELISYEYLLKTIKNQFQETYKNILRHIDVVGGEGEKIFKSFDKIIEKIIK